MELVKKCVMAECDYYKEYGECSSVCSHYMIKPVLTNYDRIRNMSVEEMAKFLESLLNGENNHNVACYGCMNYGTHHSDPENKKNGLYECGDCYNEGVGLDLVKWLNKELEDEETQ